MATPVAVRRLTKEFTAISKNPPPFITARPSDSNILEWHYVIQGPPDTPYEGGEYYGTLTFPSDYPFKPPSIRMTTPSGRFQTDTRLCLSMSDYHPSSWNPSWSVATILNGLLSFMTTDDATAGSLKTTDAEKRIYASQSHGFNRRHWKFRELFSDLSIQEPQQTNNLVKRHTNAQSPTTQDSSHNRFEQTAPSRQDTQQPTAMLVSRWRRWIVLVVVFIYLIVSKLASRTSTGDSTT